MGNPVAVVLGLRENGLGVVRALGRKGIPVVAIDDPQNRIYTQTRYAQHVACESFYGPGLIDTLCEIGAGMDEAAVLILTMDQHVPLISQHRDRLEAAFRHSLPAAEVVDALMDKGATRKYAEANGFLMPRSFEVTTEKELESCLEEITPPFILKPQSKTLAFFRYTPKKAFFTQSKEELKSAFRMISQWEHGVVLQEWIPGGDENLIFALYYFDEKSEPLGCFTGRKIRQYIPYCGTGCSAEPWDDEFISNHGLRFFQEIKYTGFAAIEFKISDRDGKYYLVEPSIGRTEHLFALAEANGINLPYIGYRHMAGLPQPEARQASSPVRYFNLKNDFKASRTYIRDKKLTHHQWLRSLRGPKQYAVFSWDDPKPFLAYCSQPLARLPKGVVRRTIRKMQSLHDSRFWSTRKSPHHPTHDVQRHIDAALEWLCRAQDAISGGGVARGYTIRQKAAFPVGWQPAYPETTGYIIPTLIDAAHRYGRPELRDRALRMADWEVEIQLSNGGVQGGVVGEPESAVVFNTGQVILGWCRAHEETNDPRYLAAIRRAGNFSVNAQDSDGGWRRHSNRNELTTVHAYDVRVSWALLMAYEATKDGSFREAALRNLEFTLSLQHANGWFRANALEHKNNAHPLTHTIAYTARGLLEAGLLLGENRYIDAARTAADAVLSTVEADGHLAGELDSQWEAAVPWCCLTGSAQMSIIWLKLFRLTGESGYHEAAKRINLYLKATQDLETSDDGIRGGIAGPWPISHGYNRYQILNWATKFFVDALLLEQAAEERAP